MNKQISMDTSGHNTRAALEKRYFDHAYSIQGLDIEKSFWIKHHVNFAYSQDFLLGLLRGLRQKKVLSLGGGVDRIGISLAQSSNTVVSVDISPVAAGLTRDLARKAGVLGRIHPAVFNCEQMHFNEKFDAAVSNLVLMHLDYQKVIKIVQELLVEGGLFVAKEPICLPRVIQWIHERFPFDPAQERTPGEVQFAESDLALIASAFREVKFHYFHILTRESLAYFFIQWRLGKILRPLGRIEYLLANRCFPILKYLSNYVIIEAVK